MSRRAFLPADPPEEAAVRFLESKLVSSRQQVDLFVLVMVDRQPRYGYDLWVALHELDLDLTRNRVYRILWRLEEAAVLAGNWERAGGSRPRRVYTVTDAGRSALVCLAPTIRRVARSLENRALAAVVRERLAASGAGGQDRRS